MQILIPIGNSALGVHNLSHIASKYKLYFLNNHILEESVKVDDGYYTELSDAIEGELDGFENETRESFFSSENEFIDENTDYLQNFGLIKIEGEEKLWKVDCFEGEWFAVHPEATWDSDKEEYVLQQ